MDPIAGCPRCKKLYLKADQAVCPKCEQDEFEDYNRVRDILEQNPDCSAEQAAELAEVTVECVLRMIDQDLIVNPEAAKRPACGRCGKPAISLKKKICSECLNTLSIELQKTIKDIKLPEPKPKEGRRMFGVHDAIDERRRLKK